MPVETSQKEPVNYLMNGQTPDKKSQEFYEKEQDRKAMFGEVWGPETHSRRRKLIIQKHPEVAQLLKPTKPYSIILTFFTVFIGLAVCYFVKDASWPVFLFVTYWVGGTIGHSLHVLIHDFTHYGGHSSITVNKFFAIMCNIPMGIPSAIPFGKHHADHHNFLGEERKDPDLPMRAESKASQYFLYKIFFWIFLTLFYALRPMFFSKNARFNRDEIINIIIIACTDLIIYKYWGANALLYLLLVAFVSIGPHPAAAHTLAEHYEFVKGQETYDYFGFWNFFNLNLGYHIEHHDFPTCPWYNLPKVRAAAPQFYQHLPYHTSYIKLLGKFLFDFNFNLYNRTLRVNKQL